MPATLLPPAVDAAGWAARCSSLFKRYAGSDLEFICRVAAHGAACTRDVQSGDADLALLAGMAKLLSSLPTCRLPCPLAALML